MLQSSSAMVWAARSQDQWRMASAASKPIAHIDLGFPIASETISHKSFKSACDQ